MRGINVNTQTAQSEQVVYSIGALHRVHSVRPAGPTRFTKCSGFSLLEMAVVLAVIGVLLSGSLSLYSEQSRHHKWKASAVKLGFVKNTLQQFSRTHHYLPCPDTDGDGLENRVGGFHCQSAMGKLPFLTLGVTAQGARDAWGHGFLYAVPHNAIVATNMRDCPRDPACFFNKDAPPRFDLTTLPTHASANTPSGFKGLKVCTALPCTANTSGAQVEADDAIVVLVALNENGGRTPIVGTAEALNQAESRFFVQATASRDPFFDDHIQVISANSLKSRHQTKVTVRIHHALPSFPVLPFLDDSESLGLNAPSHVVFGSELSQLNTLNKLSGEKKANHDHITTVSRWFYRDR